MTISFLYFTGEVVSTDLVISLNQLVWLVGGLTAIYVFFKGIMKPFKAIEEHDKDLNVLKKEIGYITKAVNALVNHAIDGNDVEKLKDVRDEYQNEMLNRHD